MDNKEIDMLNVLEELFNDVPDTEDNDTSQTEALESNETYPMQYFTYNELTASETARKYGIDNTPTEEIKRNMNELVYALLDPIRKQWGSGVMVTSGYRCPKVNSLVGGSSTSAHKYGYAADLVPVNGKLKEFKRFVYMWLINNDITFDQMIDEGSWLHIGLKSKFGKQRKQFLRYYMDSKTGKHTYEKIRFISQIKG